MLFEAITRLQCTTIRNSNRLMFYTMEVKLTYTKTNKMVPKDETS